jgi:hypothetical protein
MSLGESLDPDYVQSTSDKALGKWTRNKREPKRKSSS